MKENSENIEFQEVAVLAGIITGRHGTDFTSIATLDELAELARTAGAEVVGIITQGRATPECGTYFGEGKLQELAEFCKNNDANLIIFDDELKGSEKRNIEKITEVRVIDRSILILDIFANRAKSSEGKLQVELAQLKYMLPRLIGLGSEMSRLGAGIGTRGPGETKLETDKRHIRRKIFHLESEIKEVSKRRELSRNRRKKDGVQTIVLVGYTNAGKSSLMNYLTNAGVLVEDKLFATLDPTARKLTLPDDREILLIDTVGFIRKLPHHLIDAFKSTLEEAADADLLLNITDISSPAAMEQLEISERLLGELKCHDIPQIRVFNKCDKLDEIPSTQVENSIYISATTGYGIDELLNAIVKNIPSGQKRIQILLPYSEAALLSTIRDDGKLISEEYLSEGISIVAQIDIKSEYKYSPYEVN